MSDLSGGGCRRVESILSGESPVLGLIIDTRYEVLQPLARGGMGEIFFAHDRRLNRGVVMKILGEELSSPEWERRFRDETGAMTRLDHPGIVPVHDFGTLPDGRLYYTMRHIRGMTLAQQILVREPRERILARLAQACAIVQHAHERGILHRDLKPENIIIDERGHVYILDWGIARILQEYRRSTATGAGPAKEDPGTLADVILGTVGYMSPEQASGRLEEMDERSDVYSLGAVLYEILTGSPPATGSSTTECLEAASSGQIPSPVSLNPDISADLDAICRRAIHPDPLRRYGSARAFETDLRRFLEGASVQARPLSFLRRAIRRIRRRPAASLITLLTVFASLQMLTHLEGVRIRASETDAAYSETLRKTQRMEKAQRLLEQARPALDGYPRYLRTPEIPSHEWRGKVTHSRTLLEEALSLDPESVLARHLLGLAWEILGDSGKAEECWLRTIQLDPAFGPTYYHLGRLYLERSFLATMGYTRSDRAAKLPEAEQYARQAETHLAAAIASGARGWDQELQRDLATALHTFCSARPERLETQIREALQRHKGKEGAEDFLWIASFAAKPEKRKSFCNQVLRLCPRHFFALLNRSRIRNAERDFAGSLADLDAAIEIRPNLAGPWINRSFVHAERGEYAAAIEDIRHALEADPRCAVAYSARAQFRIESGDLSGAWEDCRRALELNPRCSPAYAFRGRLRMGRGDEEGARADFDRTIELDPEESWGYRLRGYLLRMKGEYAAALEDMDRALSLNPNLSNAFFERGMIRMDLKDWVGAESDFQKMLELVPDSASGWLHRAIVRRRLGNLPEALDDLNRAITLDPRLGLAYINRAVIRQLGEQYPEAVEDYRKGLSLLPENWKGRGETERVIRGIEERSTDGRR